jgi:hypothetical protein
MGIVGCWLMRAFAVTLRVLGGASFHMGHVLIDLYDMVIFLPLWAERRIKAQGLFDRKEPDVYPAREVL